MSQYLYEVVPSHWGRSLLKPPTKNASDIVVWLVVIGFLCKIYQIPCVVIQKEGPKHSVVSANVLWDFESHQLRGRVGSVWAVSLLIHNICFSSGTDSMFLEQQRKYLPLCVDVKK